MQQRREFWDFLAERMQETMDNGLTGPWFDCAVSSWINHANARGGRIAAPYDVDLQRPLDRDTYREYQQRKHDYLLDHFPGARLFVNWFFPRHYWGAETHGEAGTQITQRWGSAATPSWTGGTGGGAGGNERLMFSGGNGHRPISGGVIEMYANERYMDWHALMRMHLDMRDQGFCVVSWIKRADAARASDFDMPLEYQCFAYATHLLVYEPDQPLYFGPAVPPGGRVGEYTPAEYVYWDFGRSLERFEDVSQAEMPEAPGVYRRRFELGQVLVNPHLEQTRTVTLDGNYYDVQAKQRVTHVTLGPLRAALLLRPSGATPAGARSGFSG
jgi:hypothetical protein